MSDPPHYPRPQRAPTHLWVVGLLLVLWNGWGLALAIGTQTDRMPTIDPAASAFFEDQPLWLGLVADLGPLAGIAGSVALLLQSRWAARLFAGQAVILTLSNAYEIAIGRSLLLNNPTARGATLVLAAVLVGQIVYAHLMARRGVLY